MLKGTYRFRNNICYIQDSVVVIELGLVSELFLSGEVWGQHGSVLLKCPWADTDSVKLGSAEGTYCITTKFSASLLRLPRNTLPRPSRKMTCNTNQYQLVLIIYIYFVLYMVCILHPDYTALSWVQKHLILPVTHSPWPDISGVKAGVASKKMHWTHCSNDGPYMSVFHC